MRWTLITAFLLAATGLAPLAAQDTCPDQGVRTVDLPDERQGVQECGVGFSGTIGGITIQTGQATCPVSLTIIPPRDVPTPNPHTYVYADGSVAIIVAFFECKTSYFLFIPVGDSCLLRSTHKAGNLTNYSVAACSEDSQDRAQ